MPASCRKAEARASDSTVSMMFIYAYVCMYVCVCLFVSIYLFVCLCVYLYVFVYLSVVTRPLSIVVSLFRSQ